MKMFKVGRTRGACAGSRRMQMIAASAALVCAVSALVALAPWAAQARPVRRARQVARAASVEEGCTITSLPSFVAQGQGKEASTVADIVELACEPFDAGQKVELSSNELYRRCQDKLSWSTPYPFKRTAGATFKVTLDEYGDATVALWGGPGCLGGESLIVAKLEAYPYTTSDTEFTVLPPRATEEGVTASPSSQVQGAAAGGGVATIVELEFAPVYADQYVTVTAPALLRRCQVAPKLVWVGQLGSALATDRESVLRVKLDDNGNAFVVVLGGSSCATGESLIVATLEEPPFTEYTTTFTIQRRE